MSKQSCNGCNSCKNYDLGKLAFYDEDNIPHSCKLGKTIEFNNWWELNGHKKSDDILTSMDCWENTELGEKLDDFSNSLDDLLKLIKNKSD